MQRSTARAAYRHQSCEAGDRGPARPASRVRQPGRTVPRLPRQLQSCWMNYRHRTAPPARCGDRLKDPVRTRGRLHRAEIFPTQAKPLRYPSPAMCYPPAGQALSLIYTPQPRQFREEIRLVLRWRRAGELRRRRIPGHRRRRLVDDRPHGLLGRYLVLSRIARATSSCNAIASVFGRSGIMP